MRITIIHTKCSEGCGRVATGKINCCNYETEHLVRVVAAGGAAVMTMYGNEISSYQEIRP